MVNKIDCIDDFSNSVGFLENITNSDTATCDDRVKALHELHRVIQKYIQGRPLLTLASRACKLDMLLKELSLHPKYRTLVEEIACVRRALVPYFSITPRPEIKLSLGFFCEIDSPDHNGAFKRSMMNFFKNKLPILTTISLLKKLETDQLKILFNSQKEWDVLKQVGADFVLLLPKSLKSGLNLNSKLRELDFNPQALELTMFITLITSQSFTAAIENLKYLFLEEAQIDKLFYLNGHGGSDVIAGLQTPNYLQLLKLIDEQRCKGLIISTCFAGGKNGLLLEEKSYPILLRSIGDFVTYANQPAEMPVAGFNQALIQQLSSGRMTLTAFRKMVEKVEGTHSKDLANQIQVMFPHSQRASSAGFQPLLEHGEVATITQVQLKQAMIEKKYIIDIFKKIALGLYPLAIGKTLSFCHNNPLLISMIPGPSHHFIETIISDEEKPSKYFQKMINFHSRINDSKGFFIGAFDHDDELWTDISLLMTSSGHELVYMCDEKYYYRSPAGTKEIDWITHAKKVAEMERQTLPFPEAVRISSGGQESENDFKASMEDHFWSKNSRKIVHSLTQSDSVVVDSIDLGHDNFFNLIQGLVDGFGGNVNPKKLWIHEVCNSRYPIQDIVMLLSSKGLCVYRIEGNCHFYDVTNLHQIDEEAYLKMVEKIARFKT